MHARLCPAADAPSSDGALATCRLDPLDGTGGALLLSLWPDETAASVATSGTTYAVEDLVNTPNRGAALAASVTEFDGPRSVEQVAADRRATRERAWPAASQVPGLLGALVLRAADGGMVVVSLASHADALAAGVHAILSTPLLPGRGPRPAAGSRPRRGAPGGRRRPGRAAHLGRSGCPMSAPTRAGMLTQGRWTVEPATTRATFRARDVLHRTVVGSLAVVSGHVDVEDGVPVAIEALLDLRTVETASARRDTDLRGSRFFDVESSPHLSFSGGPGAADGAGWRLPGALVLRGASCPVELAVGVTLGSTVRRATATTVLDRRDLGIRVPRLLVGSQVQVTVQATLLPPGTAPA